MEGQISLWDWMPDADPEYRGTDWEAVAYRVIIKFGSGFENGHHRIVRMLEMGKLNEAFLKAEYGVGGATVFDGDLRGWLSHDGKGVVIHFGDFEKIYSWTEVLRIWQKAFCAGEIHYKGEKEHHQWVMQYFKTFAPCYDGPEFPGWGTLYFFAKGEANKTATERSKEWLDVVIAQGKKLDATHPYTWLNEWFEEYKREQQVAKLKRVLPVPEDE